MEARTSSQNDSAKESNTFTYRPSTPNHNAEAGPSRVRFTSPRIVEAYPTPQSAEEEDEEDISMLVERQPLSETETLKKEIAELQRRLEERGLLLRKSEELRMELAAETNRLKEVNDQLRYIIKPSDAEKSFPVKVKGTAPSSKRSRSRPTAKPYSKVMKPRSQTGTPLPTDSATRIQRLKLRPPKPAPSLPTSNVTASPPRSRITRYSLRDPPSNLLPSPTPSKPSNSLPSPGLSSRPIGPSGPTCAAQSHHLTSHFPHRRDVSQSSQPWFDNPATPLLPRVSGPFDVDGPDLPSTRMIEAILSIKMTDMSAIVGCNWDLISLFKQLFSEAGVTLGTFCWPDLDKALFKNRLRCIAWPAEINHNPVVTLTQKAIPMCLRSEEIELLRRVLARRLPPYNAGLQLVKWDEDESEDNGPALYVTTDGVRHSLTAAGVACLKREEEPHTLSPKKPKFPVPRRQPFRSVYVLLPPLGYRGPSRPLQLLTATADPLAPETTPRLHSFESL